ncbi:tRNA (adenosine(37)-N6)-threonylcarbamoyltransferase complex transferase subunit TsaD [Candidatus Saccharibacteria bacterium]|nr:tRNA (adenosine(37)-N6)-threonylcarbamoyltransferase complex transferase subunit TsaD [Candidatus Saccharibacteria bacterium]
MNILAIESSCDETAAAILSTSPQKIAHNVPFSPKISSNSPKSQFSSDSQISSNFSLSSNSPILLSNVVVSQIDIFKAYGGVIPEIAARSHLEAILPVIDKAFADANFLTPKNLPDWDKIDFIAVTNTPGLLGSLLVGTLTARTLALLHKKPLYAVHHLKSHIFSCWLPAQSKSPKNLQSSLLPQSLQSSQSIQSPQPIQSPTAPNHPNQPNSPQFPLLALVISGGHTQIIRMTSETSFEIVGTTLDDAIGECFDKVAKILGLPYPGGPSISKAANGILPTQISTNSPSDDLQTSLKSSKNPQTSPDSSNNSPSSSKNQTKREKPGNPEKYQLPIPNIKDLDFSFSGLKTAVLRAVQKEVGVPISYPSHELKNLLTPEQICDFAASFEKTAVDILLKKLKKALKIYPDTRSILFAGGVSANPLLRKSANSLKNYSSYYSPHDINNSAKSSKSCSTHNTYSSHDINIFFPAPEFSGDNAAMVAMAAFYEIKSNLPPTDPYSLSILPRSEIN